MYSAFLVSTTAYMSCNNHILKSLGTLQGVFGAELDRIEGRIVVNHTDEVTRDKIAAMLASLGFPEKNKDFEDGENETDIISSKECNV